MPLERRNEAQMLRSFWKQYPSYRVQPLLYKRYNELVEARAFFFFFSRTEKSQQAVPTKQAVWPGSSTTAAYIGPPQD